MQLPKEIEDEFNSAFNWGKFTEQEIERWMVMYGFTPNDLKSFIVKAYESGYAKGKEDAIGRCQHNNYGECIDCNRLAENSATQKYPVT